NDGVYTVDGSTGKSYVGNALKNDRLNGQPVTLDKITVTVDGTEKEDPAAPGTYIPVAPTEKVPELDTETGSVSVPPGTLPGTYVITYTICEVLNPARCDDATITVVVNPTTIIASDNTYGPVKGNEGNVNLGN